MGPRRARRLLGVLLLSTPSLPGSLRRLPSCEGRAGARTAGQSPRVGVCLSPKPPVTSCYFIFYGSQTVKIMGVCALPPPSFPSPYPSRSPPPLMDPHVVTFLAVKDNIKVIFISVKAPSCLRAAFPKAGRCWGGRQPPASGTCPLGQRLEVVDSGGRARVPHAPRAARFRAGNSRWEPGQPHRRGKNTPARLAAAASAFLGSLLLGWWGLKCSRGHRCQAGFVGG